MASENFDTYQAPQLRGFNRVALPPEEPKLTAAQSAYIAANLVPGAGYADFVGAMSEMPEAGVPVSQALSGPPSPGFIENIKTGHPWIAALQALGLAGDVLYPLKGIAGLKMMAMLPAYHGSPHLFDKFKMSEIGTGQGAQAYGHGLYFAENPAVAKEYRFIGNRDVFDNVKYKGRKVSEIYEDANKKMDAAYARGHRSGNFDNDEIERLANETYFWEQIMTGWHPEKLVRDILADPDEWGEGVADIARRVSSEGKWEDLDALRGTLYKVDIDETTVDQMLDWDLPLAEQPDVMKKLLDSGILETKTEAPYAGSLRISRTGVLLDPSDDGFSLVRSGGWDKKLSDDLLEAGIPGIKYFDQGSRNAFGDATEGTRNFVVFDEDIPEMVSKTQAQARFANGGAVQLGGFNRVDLPPPPEQQLSAAQAAELAAQFDPTEMGGLNRARLGDPGKSQQHLHREIAGLLAEGRTREAYEVFESLPFLEQMAVGVAPGIGDAMALYEMGEFGTRAKESWQDDSHLGALGNAAIAGLAGLSFIPAARGLARPFSRGIRALVKSSDSTPIARMDPNDLFATETATDFIPASALRFDEAHGTAARTLDAETMMRASAIHRTYKGVSSGKRQPIEVLRNEDGTYEVLGGNTTSRVLSEAGAQDVPVRVFKSEQEFAAYETARKEQKLATRKENGALLQPEPGSPTTETGVRSVGGTSLEKEVSTQFNARGNNFENAEQLHRAAIEVNSNFQRDIDDIVSEIGYRSEGVGSSRAIDPKTGHPQGQVKMVDRMEEKAAHRYNGDANQITDSIRTRILADTTQDADAIAKAISDRYPTIDSGNQIIPPGLRDRKLNIIYADPETGQTIVAEISIRPPAMHEAADQTREAYEGFRSLAAQYPDGANVPEVAEKLRNYESTMRYYFRSATQDLDPSWMADDIVVKPGRESLTEHMWPPIDSRVGGLRDRPATFKDGGLVAGQSLLDRVLGGVTRASPEEETELFKTHPYYGESKGNKFYVNEPRLRAEGSTGDFVSDMHLGEALHRLRDTAPEWHGRLQKAAAEDPVVQQWKRDSYAHSIQSGEKRPIDQWWDVSRFDQVVGGFLLGGPNANVNTMREWNRSKLPFGTRFRRELEAFEKALGRTPPAKRAGETLGRMPRK